MTKQTLYYTSPVGKNLGEERGDEMDFNNGNIWRQMLKFSYFVLIVLNSFEQPGS